MMMDQLACWAYSNYGLEHISIFIHRVNAILNADCGLSHTVEGKQMKEVERENENSKRKLCTKCGRCDRYRYFNECDLSFWLCAH